MKREHALADGRRLGKRDPLVDDDRAHVDALSKRGGSLAAEHRRGVRAVDDEAATHRRAREVRGKMEREKGFENLDGQLETVDRVTLAVLGWLSDPLPGRRADDQRLRLGRL